MCVGRAQKGQPSKNPGRFDQSPDQGSGGVENMSRILPGASPESGIHDRVAEVVEMSRLRVAPLDMTCCRTVMALPNESRSLRPKSRRMEGRSGEASLGLACPIGVAQFEERSRRRLRSASPSLDMTCLSGGSGSPDRTQVVSTGGLTAVSPERRHLFDKGEPDRFQQAHREVSAPLPGPS